jgi:hypothetical protein
MKFYVLALLVVTDVVLISVAKMFFSVSILHSAVALVPSTLLYIVMVWGPEESILPINS